MSDAMTRAREFISEHRHNIKLQLLADAENELAALLTETRTKALEEAAAVADRVGDIDAKSIMAMGVKIAAGQRIASFGIAQAIRSLKAEGGEI